MYTSDDIQDFANRALAAATRPVERHGVMVYMNADPDYAAADFIIHYKDEQGIAIFREFAAKMAAHYNTLKK
jgi:hypothetical protein